MKPPKLQNNKGRIMLRFTIEGEIYSLTHGDYNCNKSKNRMLLVAQQICVDVDFGNFDPTLEKYKFWKPQEPTKKPKNLKALDVLKAWMDSQDLSPENVQSNFAPLLNILAEAKPTSQETSWLTNRICKPSTFNKRLQTMRSAFTWAVQKNLINENPYASIKKRKDPGADIQPFTKEEISKIIEFFNTTELCSAKIKIPVKHYRCLVKFFFATGLRPSEILGLRWQAVDFENKRMTINSAISVSKTNQRGNISVGSTKTQNTWLFPISDAIEQILLEAKSLLKDGYKLNEFVFISHNGGIVNWQQFNKSVWKFALNVLRIPYRYPYQVRHTFLSYAAMNPEIGLLGASKLAGHVDSTMVVKKYARFVGEQKLPELF